MKTHATYQDLMNVVGIHPTIAEEFTTMTVTKRSGASANNIHEDAEVNPEVVGMHLRVCLEPWVTCFVAILFGPHSSMLLWMTVVI